MTGMLASVCSLDETILVQAAGVDIIDLKNPRDGALGALDSAIVREVVTHVNGVTPVSATIGNFPFAADKIEPVIRRMAQTGVDLIKVGVSENNYKAAELEMLTTLCQQGIRLVLVLFAEQYNHSCNFEKLANTGITGVMLDTGDKSNGALREKLSDSTLQGFVNYAKAHGLLCGLAGSLGAEDIAPLLDLKPDYLGFRGGLCRYGKREQVLDREMTRSLRRRIPATRVKGIQTAAMI